MKSGGEKRNRALMYGLLAALVLAALAVQWWNLERHTLRPRALPEDPAVVDGRVDVNRAGQDLLSGLPGLGSSLAGRIVAEREEHGPYRDADDLLRVPGIGEGKLDALKPYIFAGDVPEAEPTESPAVTSIPSPTPASTPVPTPMPTLAPAVTPSTAHSVPDPAPWAEAETTDDPFPDPKDAEAFLLYMNTAPLERMVRCPRIGETLAVKILTHRKRIGPFTDIEDVLTLEGVERDDLWPMYRSLRSQELETIWIGP